MDQTKTIVYFTKHTNAGPSSRYRSYAYHSFLQQNGFSVTAYSLFPHSYLRRFYKKGRKPYLLAAYGYLRRFIQLLFVRKYDIVFIEYELFPYLPFALENWLLRKRKCVVLDYDDAIFHNYDKSQNPFVKKWCGDKIFTLVQRAGLVITGSPYLTKTLLPYAKRLEEIPTSVSIRKYNSAIAAQLTDEEQKAFRIGWIGSLTTSPFVLTLKECLLQLEQLYKIELVLIGFDRKLEKELAGLHYVIYDWQPQTEISLLKTCDVGIMPLPDEAFNHGKCGFKLIQYMACGLPTISTPMEANVKINHGGNNLFANQIYEWYSCLTVMIQNRNLYKEVGQKNKAIVDEWYATERNELIYLSLFQNLTSH